ncbi:NAD-dependent epimerase [Aquabacterium sp. CECT 9606]|uniref:NAD-dependent epimerase n=1 Tax=Aquabacterium sp. CECT 9606 TaxID=2845822 RepID=UPI001E377C7E|nr:NAD-dependent epimerase [Aquabacterium sp. CECT 9606]CAH0351791.1 UDP-glucose 4-epimerase [Aquabacterium sp. CECT 9606]
MKVLVTGAAGFIGMHTTLALLARGDAVVGIDNLNDYYDPQLKRDRLAEIARQAPSAPFRFLPLDIADHDGLLGLMASEQFDAVVHLAAQAGVRYSLTHPQTYVQSNLVGFVNMLEACRHHQVKHLVYASSSSVYGGNVKMPFAETDPVDHPVSLYAATKKSNELMAHSYSHIFGLPTTGLRFFTVYGPWGRPDMAPMLFASAILAGKPITVFNHGQMQRDFTFIDDIVAGVLATLDRPPTAQADFDRAQPSSSASWAPYRIFNIGHSEPVPLLQFIETLEQALGQPAIKDLQPMAAGDVVATYADTQSLAAWTGVHPKTSLAEGIAKFVDWYRTYFTK